MDKISDTMIFLDNNTTLFNVIYSTTSTAVEKNVSLYHPCDPDPSNYEFNCSVDLFLLFNRGPKQLPLITTVLVTIFFLGIFVTGVIGNVIVCLVIIKHDSMHTATNYYLFSLAVSDLIFLLFGLPYDLSLYWHQYPYNLGLGFCKIRALISEASTYVSVLTIEAFSMERFLAICHPLHLYTMSGLQRAVRIIVALWIISFLSAVPFAVFSDIDYLNYPPTNEILMDSAFCAMLEYPENFPLWELSTCLFFVFPMVVMIVLYGKMGLRIRSRTKHSAQLGVQHGSMYNESRQSQSRKAIIRMLAAVVITFFVCWAPFHAQRLLYLYARDWQHFNIVNTWLFSVAGWLYYVSCTINPILYNVMSHRYRVAFKETLCGRKRSRAFTNGFSREQSSFRETVIGGMSLTVNAGGNSGENAKLLRATSVMSTKHPHFKDRIHTGSLRWHGTGITNANRTICTEKLLQDTIGTQQQQSNQSTTMNIHSNVIVVLGNDGNGKTKYYTTTTGTTTTSVNQTTANPTIIISNFESSNLAEAEQNNNTNNGKEHNNRYETCI